MQFKNSVPERTAMYINEQKVETAEKVAALADDYLLTHKRGGGESHAYGDNPVGVESL